MKHLMRMFFPVTALLVLVSCGPADKLWPSDKIGPMWVNRYGHSNSPLIWEYCDDSMSEAPGIRTSECTVPWIDELFIGHGVSAPDIATRDALWEARTWELFIDGHEVDLPAFNIADFEAEIEGANREFRIWRIRLRKIPAGLHTLYYVMHVNQEVENDPLLQSVGKYELIVNFTFEEK